jgi:hypothetical protein
VRILYNCMRGLNLAGDLGWQCNMCVVQLVRLGVDVRAAGAEALLAAALAAALDDLGASNVALIVAETAQPQDAGPLAALVRGCAGRLGLRSCPDCAPDGKAPAARAPLRIGAHCAAQYSVAASDSPGAKGLWTVWLSWCRFPHAAALPLDGGRREVDRGRWRVRITKRIIIPKGGRRGSQEHNS